MSTPLNTVICVLNSKYIHSSLAPWYLAAGIDAFCEGAVTAQIVEGTINERIDDVAERIVKLNPQVIGFSCYIWNVSKTKQLIGLVKKSLSDAVIVLGGPEVSYNAQAVLKNEPLVDFIVSGEGEKPFAQLLSAIKNKTSPKGVPGLCYRDDDNIIISSPNISDTDPPCPYTDEYMKTLKGRIAYLETGRGCPYSCAFCLSGRCGNVHFFDLDRAKRELLRLSLSGAKTIKLVDRTFNANKKRANEIFKFIIDNYNGSIPKGVCFHFEIAGDILDDQTIDLLSTAPIGAIQLEIGLQSFNTETLSAINRKTDVERLKNNIKRLVENANMHIHIDLIAGLPYEDITSFSDSFNTAYKLKPNMLQLGFLKLLHGADMRERPQDFPCRYSKDPPYEIIETPWINSEELNKLRSTEDALERLYNSGRFRRTLDYLLSKYDSPFSLFYEFGQYSAEVGTSKITLDNYTSMISEYFVKHGGVEKDVLRDIMVCDRISTNSSGRIPRVLQIKDPLLKKAKLQLEKTIGVAYGTKRGFAILYSEQCLAFADYTDRNPITKEYKLKKFPLNNLI